MNNKMKWLVLSGVLFVGCEPEKEVVEVDPNIFNTDTTDLDVVGDWIMTSLDENVYPELSSERY